MNIQIAREELRRGKTIYDMPLKVAYYARVSTDKSDQLNSLENQQKYFEEMIYENKNWLFCGSYIDEGISGTAVKKRSSFLKMIESATTGQIDLILTKEISRFSRNTVDSIKYTEYLLKNGVIVYFLSDNLNTISEDAEFRLTIMSSLAQDEIRKLSERVKFGINRMIKERKLIGGNLTGYYKKNGKYKINKNEAPIIKYLFETYVTGTISLKQIGINLAKMGYLNTKGKPYSSMTLAKFLTNPRYKGYYTAKLTEVENYKTHKKRVVPLDKQIIEKDNRIPKIIEETLWNKCNAIYQKKKKSPSRHILNQEEILEHSKYSLLIFCKHCQNIYTRNGGSNRKNNPTWACKTYRKEGVNICSSPIIKETYLDKLFIKIIDNLLKNNKNYYEKILTEYESLLKKRSNNFSYKEKIITLEKQKEKLLNLNLEGIINDIDFKNKNDKLTNDINHLKKNINIYHKQESLEKLKESLSDKLNISKYLPYLIKLLINKIEIEKIDNNRKNIKLSIFFNFNKDPIYEYLNL